jgi:hypothetical protein
MHTGSSGVVNPFGRRRPVKTAIVLRYGWRLPPRFPTPRASEQDRVNVGGFPEDSFLHLLRRDSGGVRSTCNAGVIGIRLYTD